MGNGGNARVAVGGRTCGIELDCHHSCRVSLFNFNRGRVVSEVERHQWLEHRASRQGLQDTLAVGQCKCGGGDGRLEVGHDHRAGKLRSGVRQHMGQYLAIAKMHMPVVGAGECE